MVLTVGNSSSTLNPFPWPLKTLARAHAGSCISYSRRARERVKSLFDLMVTQNSLFLLQSSQKSGMGILLQAEPGRWNRGAVLSVQNFILATLHRQIANYVHDKEPFPGTLCFVSNETEPSKLPNVDRAPLTRRGFLTPSLEISNDPPT